MEEHIFNSIIDKIKESNSIFFEDIENLANSSFTENKFYHLFNDLYESDKKIIIIFNKTLNFKVFFYTFINYII